MTRSSLTVRYCITGLTLIWASSTSARAADNTWDVQSPNGRVRIVVQLGTPAAADNPQGKARLYYRVEHGDKNARAVMIGDSPMGLVIKGHDFVDGLKFTSVDPARKIEERYSLPHGKRHERHNQANAVVVHFKNAAGEPLDIEMRAYDDGAGFRYILPGRANGVLTLEAEATGFALPKDGKLWMQPHEKGSTYCPAYETFYENGVAVDAPPASEPGWSLPVLFRTADEQHWGLIVDAAIGPDNYGIHLEGKPVAGVYRVGLPDPGEGIGYGADRPWFKLPWKSAWRAVILGDSCGAMVESTLVDDLNPPTTMTDMSWIKPGRVSWSWWADPPSPMDGGKMKHWVDWAAEMGWEYVLVDANWTIMDNGNVHDVIRHAKSKNVGVLLWYNSGGPMNVVTEKPRDSLFFPEVRRHELDMLKGWGVRGLKVDFFQSDKPEIMALYHDILKDAADRQIMISYHGCTMARGWSRTYPHLVSMEAVRGEETYMFHDAFPDTAPVQNTILPFTRNAIGPMDYTPVGLSNKKFGHKTSYAHELALSVLFESAWLNYADSPEVYKAQPTTVIQMMKDVPATWDETRFVSGYPGREVAIARRHDHTWYVACVNGGQQPMKYKLDPKAFLPAGQYQMTMIGDGEDAKHWGTLIQKTDERSAPWELQLLPYGGFVAQFKPAK